MEGVFDARRRARADARARDRRGRGPFQAGRPDREPHWRRGGSTRPHRRRRRRGDIDPAAIAGHLISRLSGCSFTPVLPVGLFFSRAAWSGPSSLKPADAFEQANHHRRLPRFLPTAATAPHHIKIVTCRPEICLV